MKKGYETGINEVGIYSYTKKSNIKTPIYLTPQVGIPEIFLIFYINCHCAAGFPSYDLNQSFCYNSSIVQNFSALSTLFST